MKHNLQLSSLLATIKKRDSRVYASLDAASLSNVQQYLQNKTSTELIDMLARVYVEDCLPKDSPAREDFVSVTADLHMASEYGA